MSSRVLAGVVGLMLVTTPAWAQLDQLLKGLGLGQPGTLSDAKIGMGLKEVLQIATDNSVTLTGKVDGYFGNQAIRILMPEQLKSLETGLRAVGYGPQVDEFVLSMNRAAERAAPAAKQIFLDAIDEMTFDDARKILHGGDTAATDFFKTKTTDKLMAAFKPVIDQSDLQPGRLRDGQGARRPLPRTRGAGTADSRQPGSPHHRAPQGRVRQAVIAAVASVAPV